MYAAKKLCRKGFNTGMVAVDKGLFKFLLQIEIMKRRKRSSMVYEVQRHVFLDGSSCLGF